MALVSHALRLLPLKHFANRVFFCKDALIFGRVRGASLDARVSIFASSRKSWLEQADELMRFFRIPSSYASSLMLARNLEFKNLHVSHAKIGLRKDDRMVK